MPFECGGRTNRLHRDTRRNPSLATVQRHTVDRKLYSYQLDKGDPVLSIWQFNAAGNATIPLLADVLHALPDDLHPHSVAGFFLTPPPDLVLKGDPVSAKAWLEAGGNSGLVIDLAEGLAAGY